MWVTLIAPLSLSNTILRCLFVIQRQSWCIHRCWAFQNWSESILSGNRCDMMVYWNRNTRPYSPKGRWVMQRWCDSWEQDVDTPAAWRRRSTVWTLDLSSSHGMELCRQVECKYYAKGSPRYGKQVSNMGSQKRSKQSAVEGIPIDYLSNTYQHVFTYVNTRYILPYIHTYIVHMYITYVHMYIRRYRYKNKRV